MRRQMKYVKLKEDWTVILELLQQHRERMAALLVAKKASKTLIFALFVRQRVCCLWAEAAFATRMEESKNTIEWKVHCVKFGLIYPFILVKAWFAIYLWIWVY